MDLRKMLLYATPIFLSLSFMWWLLRATFYVQYFTQFCVLLALMVVAWTLAHFIYDHTNTETVSPDNKAVLITGCDTGFGNQLAQRLDEYGFHVFAGVLFPQGEGAQQLKEKCSKRMHVVQMDVTKPEDVQRVVGDLKQSNKSLWAVVNNAGIALGCPFDWGNDVDEYKKTFEVNVFGLVRTTKYCIPLLRQSKGRVVNVASVAGRMTVPIMGHYCMAKNSVRVFSDVARRELYNSGVQVVTIEPTFYKTPIINFEQINRTRERIYEQTPDDIKQAYSQTYIKSLDSMEKLVNVITRHKVSEVVDTLEKAVTLQNPKLFYRCCGYQDVLMWAASHLPEAILDFCVSGVMYNKFTIQLAKRYISLFKSKQKAT